MKRLIKYFILLLVVVLAAATTYIGWTIFASVEIKPESRHFEIESGQTVKQITSRLASHGIVKSPFWFRTYVWLTRSEGKFMAGTIDLPGRINVVQLLNYLTTGAFRPVKTLTIPEGWTIQDIAVYLENNGLWQQEELTDSLNAAWYDNLVETYPILKTRKEGQGLEGYLFPDTYQIYTNARIEDLINKMLSNFELRITPELRATIERQGKNFYDVLIMASIIEAEVPHEEDRPIVADIFWSRLKNNVALQSDATLKYIIGGQRPALTSEELKMDSPYNTYKYKGLPPTPIGNPGLSAIKAAIYPAKTDYFYFISTPDGKTIFSKTLQEHNQAKAQYLK